MRVPTGDTYFQRTSESLDRTPVDVLRTGNLAGWPARFSYFQPKLGCRRPAGVAETIDAHAAVSTLPALVSRLRRVGPAPSLCGVPDADLRIPLLLVRAPRGSPAEAHRSRAVELPALPGNVDDGQGAVAVGLPPQGGRLVQRPLRHAVVVDRYGCVLGVLLSVLLGGPGCGDREPHARVNVVVDGRCSGVVDGRRRLERTRQLHGQRELDVDSLGLASRLLKNAVFRQTRPWEGGSSRVSLDEGGSGTDPPEEQQGAENGVFQHPASGAPRPSLPPR
jgi:hypothetical protein